ncbi:calcium-binding protein [Streptomyces sp. NPDC035033]|uniref:calcium-binding protein n=1 Tax=Streptomyces sp. NPDC035033 TaxID=3155368 RepID=UPI0033FC750C
MSLKTPWRRAGHAGVVSAAALALVLGLPAVATAAPGDLDPAFDGDGRVVTDLGGFAGAQDVLVQPDGKIVTIGDSYSSETSGDFTLTRYNPDGSLDTTFGGDGVVTTDFVGANNDEGRGVALQPDGKIVAVGGSTDWGGNGAWAAARYLPDGSLDTSFGEGGRVLTEIDVDAIETAEAVVVQPDGKIVAGGSSNGVWSLVRWDSSGVPDPAFSGDGRVTTALGPTCCHGVNDLALQADGKIVAAGRAAGLTVTRYNPDGGLDTTFDGDGIVTTGAGSGEGVALQSDGRIVVAGRDGNAFLVSRFTTGGAPDPSFDGDGRVITSFGPEDGGASGVALQSDGRIVAAGHYNGDFALARYNTGGGLDPDFGGDGRVTTDFGGPDDAAAQVALQADGKIVAAGLAGTVGSFEAHRGLARYLGGGGTEPPAGADVSVTKTGPSAVSIGDTATYTVRVTNNSTTTAATSVQLTDVLTGTATILSATTDRGTCTTVPGRVTCAIGTLNPVGGPSGSAATVTIVAEPSRTGTLTDTATVTAAQTDPATGNNTASRTTTVNNNRGCTLIGTSGADTLNGTYGADVICALSGNDTVNAGFGNDTVHAGPGNDRADGSYHNDTLIGGPGADTLLGNYGYDSLNTVDGVGGNDTANGGYNTDTCTTDSGDVRVSCP